MELFLILVGAPVKVDSGCSYVNICIDSNHILSEVGWLRIMVLNLICALLKAVYQCSSDVDCNCEVGLVLAHEARGRSIWVGEVCVAGGVDETAAHRYRTRAAVEIVWFVSC